MPNATSYVVAFADGSQFNPIPARTSIARSAGAGPEGTPGAGGSEVPAVVKLQMAPGVVPLAFFARIDQ